MLAVVLLLVVLIDCCATAYMLGKYRQVVREHAQLTAALVEMQHAMELRHVVEVEG